MSEEIKEIFETLIKYTNLTPDAIDDLYYLQGYIEEKMEEIDRLNNIINGIEAYCNMAITMNFNMNNSKLQEQIVEDYTNVLNKLKELKDSDKE